MMGASLEFVFCGIGGSGQRYHGCEHLEWPWVLPYIRLGDF